jgi:hypothetical protein
VLDEMDRMKVKNMNTLMIAAGGEESSKSSSTSICEILSKFSVGTENRKGGTTGSPDPVLIGAIKDLPNQSLVSAEHTVITKMKRKQT